MGPKRDGRFIEVVETEVKQPPPLPNPPVAIPAAPAAVVAGGGVLPGVIQSGSVPKYGVGPALQDMPCVYLMDRSSWGDFKRALNNCGLSWNLPDWMHTVVYKGKKYLEIESQRPDLALFFPETNMVVEGKAVAPDTNQGFMDMLGFPKTMGEYIQPGMRYCNLNKLEFEPDHKLPARQKLWSWIVVCLHGPKSASQPGPFYYLTHQCVIYDISILFKRLWDVLETVTICSLDDEVYAVTHLEFNPAKEDLFTYIEEVRRAVRRLDDLNQRLPIDGRVVFTRPM